jgi:hypothetical protein
MEGEGLAAGEGAVSGLITFFLAVVVAGIVEVVVVEATVTRLMEKVAEAAAGRT